MGVVDAELIHEGTRVAFSSVEEQVGGEEGSFGSEEKPPWVPSVPVDSGRESIYQCEDGEGNGIRQRETLGTRSGVLLVVVQTSAHPRHERA